MFAPIAPNIAAGSAAFWAPAFSEASNKAGKAGIKFGVLDCDAKFPKGDTTAEKFDIDTKTSPVVFMAANGGKPKQIPVATASDAGSLISYIKRTSKPPLLNFNKDKGFGAKLPSDKLQQTCFKKKTKNCAILIKEGSLKSAEKKDMEKLQKKYRKTSFIFVDARVFTLKNEITGSLEEGKVKFAMFKQLPVDGAGGRTLKLKDTEVKAGGRVFEGKFEAKAVNNFMASDADASYKALSMLPTLTIKGKEEDNVSDRDLSRDEKDDLKASRKVERERRKAERNAQRKEGGDDDVDGSAADTAAAAAAEEEAEDAEDEEEEEEAEEEEEVIEID
jgi:hypothetical protein